MCGIAGYIGDKNLSNKIIQATLDSLKERGPDFQASKKIKLDFKKKISANLFHSRLSIIDLNKRSNQPLNKHGLTIIFNGEIYNYKELRKKLIKKGYNFKTLSDTEVILSGYKEFGIKFFSMMKGMWAIAITDKKKKEVILSRDRFGEKPIYFYKKKNDFYFASQIKQIQILSNHKFLVNKKQIFNYLCLGYRSLEKFNYNFFKNIQKVKSGSIIKFNLDKLEKKKYWSLNYNPETRRQNYSDFIKKIREKVIQAIKRNVISDVPVSVLLSGGLDSNIILSVVRRILKKKVKTFSIIDTEKKYNEKNLINIALKKNKVKNYNILLKRIKMREFISEIEKLIIYNQKPLYTITSFISNKLHKIIKRKKIKVSLTGVGADELFAGYYSHGLHYLFEQKNKENFKEEFASWKKNILKNIRNPHFLDYKKFLKKKNYSDYVFYTNKNLKKIIKYKKYSKFSDKSFCKDSLRNRMLNEILFETVPPILNEDDQNHMYSSVENRSPFLDVDLVEFVNTIPTKFLIKNSVNKYLLREAFKDLLPSKIYYNKIKKGFNASIDSLVNRDRESFQIFFGDKKKKIYNYVDFYSLKKLFLKKKINNSESMFLFRFINCSIFLDRYA